MSPLSTENVAASQLRMFMSRYGATYMPDRSNNLRHIYYSRRLQRWFAVSASKVRGQLVVNHYASCPCGAST